MATDIRPVIFVSATSRDLGSCRRLVKEALLTLGCTPVEQMNFPPDARSVKEMLRARLKDCQAVVHIAGDVYGSEPTERGAGEARRSYTQLEVDIARALGIPVYVFICADGFPYDPHEPEPEELRALQIAHRADLMGTDRLYESVAAGVDLEKRVLSLQNRVERLKAELARTRRRLWWGLGIGAAAIMALAGGLWWVFGRTTANTAAIAQNTAEISKVRTELDQQRGYIKSVGDAYTRLQSELKSLKLTPEQLWDRALASVAEREKIDPARLRSDIELFVAAVKADPGASFMDQALADFAQKNFTGAADNAGKAADQAQSKLEAAERLAARAAEEAGTARDQVRAARRLQGQSLFADGKHEQAVNAFEQALTITARSEDGPAWAEFHVRLGDAAGEWALRSEGGAIAERRARAIAAYRAALEVFTRADLPQEWARTQNNLAIALGDQALASPGPERAGLLAEAVSAYRAALEVYTRADLPQQWAANQNNLANALGDQASASPGPERAGLLAEAVSALRAALEVYTRADLPQQWAMTQNNLALALADQASASPGPERAGLLAEAVSAYRAALQVRTRADLPQDWAATQGNLARALRDQADTRADAANRLEDARAAAATMRASIEVATKDVDPEGFAESETWLAEVDAEIRRLEADAK